MSTTTMRPNRGGIGFLEFTAIILIIATILSLVSLTIPKIKWSAHANAHVESSKIQQCLEKGNVLQVWINSKGERLNCIVDLEDGKVGDAVLQYSCRQLLWLGITAYMIGDGDLQKTIEVMNAKSCQKVFP